VRFSEEPFHRGTAARLTAACLAILDELGPSGADLNAIAGEASIERKPTPEAIQPWIALRIRAHRARHDAAAMRSAGLGYLRRELRDIKGEAYGLFAAETVREEQHEAEV